MTPHAQANAVSQLVVFSRVEPSHKTRLVEVLKSQVLLSLKRTRIISALGQPQQAKNRT